MSFKANARAVFDLGDELTNKVGGSPTLTETGTVSRIADADFGGRTISRFLNSGGQIQSGPITGQTPQTVDANTTILHWVRFTPASASEPTLSRGGGLWRLQLGETGAYRLVIVGGNGFRALDANVGAGFEGLDPALVVIDFTKLNLTGGTGQTGVLRILQAGGYDWKSPAMSGLIGLAGQTNFQLGDVSESSFVSVHHAGVALGAFTDDDVAEVFEAGPSVPLTRLLSRSVRNTPTAARIQAETGKRPF
jgi:hypothetical protein